METVKFSDVVTRANTKEDRFNTDKIYYVGGEHIDSNEMKIEKRGIIAGSTIGPMFYCGFKSGDILFVTRNPHLRKCGVVDFDGICSEKTFVLETQNRDILLQEYLAIVMQSDDFWNYCEENKSGGVNYFLNWSTLAEYEFYLPSLAEQKVLAEKLWAAYEVKQSYLKMIAATEEMVKAQFIEMFGNPLSSVQRYPLKKLGDCCELNPRRPNLTLKDTDKVSFVPMPSVSENGYLQDVIDEEYGKVKKGFTYFENDDILFAKITPCMENGKGAIAVGLTNNIGMGSTEFHVLRPISGISNPYWLLALTRLPNFRVKASMNMSGTGGQKRVPASYLDNFMVGLPPIELQEQFTSIYKQSDKSISELRKSVDAIDKVIKSLINENL